MAKPFKFKQKKNSTPKYQNGEVIWTRNDELTEDMPNVTKKDMGNGVTRYERRGLTEGAYAKVPVAGEAASTPKADPNDPEYLAYVKNMGPDEAVKRKALPYEMLLEVFPELRGEYREIQREPEMVEKMVQEDTSGYRGDVLELTLPEGYDSAPDITFNHIGGGDTGEEGTFGRRKSSIYSTYGKGAKDGIVQKLRYFDNGDERMSLEDALQFYDTQLAPKIADMGGARNLVIPINQGRKDFSTGTESVKTQTGTAIDGRTIRNRQINNQSMRPQFKHGGLLTFKKGCSQCQ